MAQVFDTPALGVRLVHSTCGSYGFNPPPFYLCYPSGGDGEAGFAPGCMDDLWRSVRATRDALRRSIRAGDVVLVVTSEFRYDLPRHCGGLGHPHCGFLFDERHMRNASEPPADLDLIAENVRFPTLTYNLPRQVRFRAVTYNLPRQVRFLTELYDELIAPSGASLVVTDDVPHFQWENNDAQVFCVPPRGQCDRRRRQLYPRQHDAIGAALRRFGRGRDAP